MTPQLRQAIRLLQLSAVELEAELVEAVESNPLLDWTETAIATGDGAAAPSHDGNGAAEAPPESRMRRARFLASPSAKPLYQTSTMTTTTMMPPMTIGWT